MMQADELSQGVHHCVTLNNMLTAGNQRLDSHPGIVTTEGRNSLSLILLLQI